MQAPSIIETELALRREKLEAARAGLPGSEQISRLLFEVDEALARLRSDRYGICEVCHGPIEPDRLAADPLTRTCLDDLSAGEQRALERDLDLTGRIQHTLLPPRPFTAGAWRAWYEYQPARTASGDYCDLLTDDAGDLVFLVGDVSGKGVAASVLMAHLHATFRSLVSLRTPFDELVSRANRLFCESTGGLHYATVVCGRASADGRIALYNAGHCPALRLHGSGLDTIDSTSLPIGLFCTAPYVATDLTLGPGDTLLVYTDGVTDAEDDGGGDYGIGRLTDVVMQHRHRTADDLIAACAADLGAFRGAAARTDDVTLLALRRER
jgi:sigma-B regulation protein RsbU (phosphoserine phosphatase)